MKKAIASILITSTVLSNTTVSKASDVLILEEAAKATTGTPIAPFIIGGGLIVTGITSIIGIKNKETGTIVYSSLEYLPNKWKPNSVVERVKENGKIIQRRWYGEDGRPAFDVDLTNHGCPKSHPFSHNGAHKHIYTYDGEMKRHPGEELTEEEYNKYVKNFNQSVERVTVKRIRGGKR